MVKTVLACVATVLLTAVGASAAPTITYTGEQQVGAIHATYSITTNGDLGSDAATDVVDYLVTLTGDGYTNTINPLNSSLAGSFTASSTSLSIVGSQTLNINSAFVPGSFGSGQAAIGYSNFLFLASTYTNAGLLFSAANATGAVTYAPANNASGFASVQVPVVSAAVPEAATWAMMMVGLGVVGGSLRRRRPVGTRISFA